MASSTLMTSAFLRFSPTRGLAASGRRMRRCKASAASVAKARFIAGAGCRDQNRVATRIAQRFKVDWHWLGVAKQDRRTHYEQQRRQQNGSKRIDVLEWIKADAAESPRGIVAAQPRDISVRRFMECNGDSQGDDPGRGV